jgi:malonyl-CoA O-methyltransferase
MHNVYTEIETHFNKAYLTYDFHCDIQNEAGRLLLNDITYYKPLNIIDLGCGTGNFTKLLANRFCSSNIYAVDISKNFIEIAKTKLPQVEFKTADFNTFSYDKTFDLITANMSLQWSHNFHSTINHNQLPNCRKSL